MPALLSTCILIGTSLVMPISSAFHAFSLPSLVASANFPLQCHWNLLQSTSLSASTPLSQCQIVIPPGGLPGRGGQSFVFEVHIINTSIAEMVNTTTCTKEQLLKGHFLLPSIEFVS